MLPEVVRKQDNPRKSLTPRNPPPFSGLTVGNMIVSVLLLTPPELRLDPVPWRSRRLELTLSNAQRRRWHRGKGVLERNQGS